jgi:hypothetical protein
MFDVIVIGGGIAGLYTTHLLLKQAEQNKNVLLIESSNRLGGRAGNAKFYNQSITIGAGIGRKNKDKLLMSLLNEFNIKYEFYKTKKQYYENIYGNSPPSIIPVNIIQLKNKIKNSKYFKNNPHKKFSDLATKILGSELYERFVDTNGYTDFENADASDVIYDYGLEDNTAGWYAFGVKWNQLIKNLSKNIPYLLETRVVKINRLKNGFNIKLNSDITLKTKKIVIATNIVSIKELLNYDIYNYIKGQPFLRMYAKIKNLKLECMTIVPRPIQKIIPLSEDIYMILYNDNESAEFFKPYLTNPKAVENIFKQYYPEIEIESIKSYYWEIGTHYYEPLPIDYNNRDEFIYKSQRPEKDIYVVGEVVAKDQGWVEGALKSVEKIINEI